MTDELPAPEVLRIDQWEAVDDVLEHLIAMAVEAVVLQQTSSPEFWAPVVVFANGHFWALGLRRGRDKAESAAAHLLRGIAKARAATMGRYPSASPFPNDAIWSEAVTAARRVAVQSRSEVGST